MGSLGSVGVVVVFDFDKTIIDCDSDNWVVDALGATRRFDELVAAMPWNLAVDKVMGELHEKGVTIADIVESLKEVPLDPCILEGIRCAHALGCELRVLSDANLFFIETILEHHGILGCFSEIHTNPAHVDGDGRLRISPYHDFREASHGCPLATCPPNMCKGKILAEIRAAAEAQWGSTRFVYLGDGKGDYCPSLKLTPADSVMPRRNHPVWELICGEPRLIRAEIHGWSDGEEQRETLLQLINKAPASRACQKLPVSASSPEETSLLLLPTL